MCVACLLLFLFVDVAFELYFMYVFCVWRLLVVCVSLSGAVCFLLFCFVFWFDWPISISEAAHSVTVNE